MTTELADLGDKLLTPDQVADYLSVPRNTVLDLSQGKNGPDVLPCIKINARTTRYRPADITAWLDRRAAAAAPMLRDQLVLKRAPSPARRRRTA